MAVRGPFRVQFGDVFPLGAFVKGGVEAVRDFDQSTKERPVQARDKDTGELMWSVEVLDADPEAKGSIKVKIIAPVQPILPEAPAGYPFVPVEFDGLTVTPYVNSQNNRLAYSLKAAVMRSPAGKQAGSGRTAAAKDAA
jgi:hypothetical protein